MAEIKWATWGYNSILQLDSGPTYLQILIPTSTSSCVFFPAAAFHVGDGGQQLSLSLRRDHRSRSVASKEASHLEDHPS